MIIALSSIFRCLFALVLGASLVHCSADPDTDLEWPGDDDIRITNSPGMSDSQSGSNVNNDNVDSNRDGTSTFQVNGPPSGNPQSDGNTTPVVQSDLCAYFPGSAWCQGYLANLTRIQNSSFRSRVEDASPYRDTPQDDLIVSNLLGPRSDYLEARGGNPERSFPTFNVGNFRIGCEFSHFAYDDPFKHPGKPGASYLQMFFGNTDVNAYSTYESLRNAGGSTCNGHELNRSGYWVPAMFDGNGYVRVPERVVVYYKGYGEGNGKSIAFPEKAAIVSQRVHRLPNGLGGSPGEVAYKCSDRFSTNNSNRGDTLEELNCDSEDIPESRRTVLEVVIKFPQCYVGRDPDNFESSYSLPEYSWFGSHCEELGYQNLPSIEYFVNYPLGENEDISDWFLASDVSPDTFQLSGERGDSIDGKWWGAWRKDVNQQWIDNCVNHQANGERAGCGFGYLTNGGPDGKNPWPGPALKYREQYTGPIKIPVEQIFSQLCDTDRTLTSDASAAWCNPQ